jgi:hypothetical protein
MLELVNSIKVDEYKEVVDNKGNLISALCNYK